MSGPARPLRFIGGTLAIWATVRAVMLVPAAERALAPAPLPVRILLGMPAQAAVRPVPPRVPAPVRTIYRSPAPVPRNAPPSTVDHRFALVTRPFRPSPAASAMIAYHMAARRRLPVPPSEPVFAGLPPSLARARWSGDAYVHVRAGSGDAALSPGPALGGSQAFARIAYRPDPAGSLALTARASAPLETSGAEAALGIRWHAAHGAHVAVERRVAVTAGARDAWSAHAAAGIDGRRIGPLVLDGYMQAGMVGAHRRDGFVDGAVRLARPVGRASVGAGLWGAAQPGARRLDMGPQLRWRIDPPGPSAAVVALEWRRRIGGDARPGSGVALTLAAGF